MILVLIVLLLGEPRPAVTDWLLFPHQQNHVTRLLVLRCCTGGRQVLQA